MKTYKRNLNLKDNNYSSFLQNVNKNIQQKEQKTSNIESWKKEIELRNKSIPAKNRTKLAKCIDCDCYVETSIYTLDKDVRCKDCKTLHNKLLNRKHRNTQKEKYKYAGPFTCLVCGKEFKEDWRTDLSSLKEGPPKYCSIACTNKHSSSCRKENPTKYVVCLECGKEFETSLYNSQVAYCPDCSKKLKYIKISFNRWVKKGFCGSFEDFKKLFFNKDVEDIHNLHILNENKYLIDNYLRECFIRPKEQEVYYYQYEDDSPIGKFERGLCFKRKEGVLVNINFDFYAPLDKEWQKHHDILYKLVWEEGLSKLEIKELFNLPFTSSVTYLYTLFNMDFAYVDGSNYKYEMGLHTSWEGNEYVYRSSYELILMKYMDLHKIHYLANGRENKIKIRYIDPYKDRERSGYPDFYLPDYNVIVETKGECFYDEKDLKARYEVIKKEGKDFLVIGYDDQKDEFNYYLSFFEDKEREKEVHQLLEIKHLLDPSKISYEKVVSSI